MANRFTGLLEKPETEQTNRFAGLVKDNAARPETIDPLETASKSFLDDLIFTDKSIAETDIVTQSQVATGLLKDLEDMGGDLLTTENAIIISEMFSISINDALVMTPAIAKTLYGESLQELSSAVINKNLKEDIFGALRETPENIYVGTLGMAAGALESIKRRSMQLAGAGVFPDENIKRQFEVYTPSIEPIAEEPGLKFPDYRDPFRSVHATRRPLPGAIVAEAVAMVTRLPDIGAKILRSKQLDIQKKQDIATIKNAPITKLARLVNQGGVPSMAVALGTSLITGNPFIGLAILAETEGGSAFEEQLQAGGSITKSAIIAELSGAAEIAGESLVFPKILKGLKGGVSIRQGFSLIAENATQEGVTGFSQQFLDTFGKETTQGTDITDAAKMAYIDGVKAIPENAFVGGVIGGGAGAISVGVDLTQRALSAKESKVMADNIVEQVEIDLATPDPTPAKQTPAEPTTTIPIEDRGLESLTDAQIDELEKAIPEITPEVRASLKAQRDTAIAKAEGEVAETKRIISTEAFDAARARILDRNILKSGINPRDFVDLATIGAFHFETGAKKFAAWSKIMIGDMGEKIKPHLERIWRDVTGAKDTEKVDDDFDDVFDFLEEDLPVAEKAKIQKAKPLSEVKKDSLQDVLNDEVFQIESEAADVRSRQVDVGLYFVPRKFKGEVRTAIENDPSLAFNVTFEKGKGTPFDTAIQEGFLQREGDATDKHLDISEFLDRVSEAKRSQGKIGGVSEVVLSKMIKSGNPVSQIIATKYEMLVNGESIAKINEEIKGIAENSGLPVEPFLVTTKRGIVGLTREEARAAGKEAAAELRQAQAVGEKVGFKAGQRAERGKIDGIRKSFKEKQTQVEGIKKKLVEYANQNLPLNERGKMLAQVKNVKTVNQLNKAIDLADRLSEKHNQRVLRAQITKTLKKTKPKKQAGIVKGRFTADIQDRIEGIKKNINNDRQSARDKIFSNIEAIASGVENADALELENENLSMQGIKGMTSGELQQALDTINQIIDKGKTDRQVKREARSERRQDVRKRIFDIITGGKGLKPGTVSLPASQLAANETFIDRIANWQYGWDELLDKMSKFDPSAPFQSDLSKFGDIVHKSETLEAAGIEEQVADFTENFKRIFDAKTKGDFKKALVGLQSEVVIGPIANADGVEITIEMTTDQAIKKYMELQDPTLQATFIGGINEETGKPFGMRWTPEIIQEVNDSLTAQEKSYGDWQLSWYRKYYPSVNKVFRDSYNINMPFNPFYSPIGRDVEVETPEPQLLAKEAIQYASTINGSLKSRQGSIKPLRFNDSSQVLLNHITKMEHFRAWNESVGDLRSIFGTPDIRKAIQQYQGKSILRTTDDFIQDMARGGISRDKVNRVADVLRINFTKSILGLKPLIAIKQIPSMLAYITEMPAGDFVNGVVDFWSNPVDNYKTLIAKSPDLRKRYGFGFERDIRDAAKQDWVKKLSGSADVSDWFFAMIKAGDRFATVQGSWAKYQSELKAGKSDDAAIASAVQSTNRTQPTSTLSTLSAGQRGGSFVKLLTMFQNQPNKYFRVIATNARALKYHRGSQLKAATNIAVAWVVLPMLFQFISDAFRFRKEKQLQAALLGPANNLLIVGSLAKTAVGWAFGEMYDYQGSPVLSTGRKAKAAVSKLTKQNVTTEDVVASIEFMAEAVGQVAGIPTPAIVQAEKAIRRKEPLQLIFSEHSLRSSKKKKGGGRIIP